MSTASSALAIKYKHGFILGTDTMLNYGRLQIPFMSRLLVLNGTMFAFSGDIGDIQYLMEFLTIKNENYAEENFTHKESSKINYRSNLSLDEEKTFELYSPDRGLSAFKFLKLIQEKMYNRRSEMKPLNVSIVIAGKVPKSDQKYLEEMNYSKLNDNENILYCVNKLGNFFTSNVVCTDYSHHVNTPFLRKFFEDEKYATVEEEDAMKIFTEAMRVKYIRDCSGGNEVEVLVFNESLNSIKIKKMKLKVDWDI